MLEGALISGSVQDPPLALGRAVGFAAVELLLRHRRIGICA